MLIVNEHVSETSYFPQRITQTKKYILITLFNVYCREV